MIPPLHDGRLQELKEEGFTFACHPGVACFNQCCRRLTLWLTPYDALRLKRRLGITSQELIERYAEMETGQNGWPMPQLAMRADDPEHTCPFLGEGGCTVYEDRPGACRTYPLGRATKGGTGSGPSEEAFFLVREDHCQGFAEGRYWTPAEWTKDQGLETYNHVNDLFLPIITRQAPDPDPQIIARKMQMFMMACYDLETFRKFINSTRFRQVFAIPAQRLELAEANDLELLKLAFDWLRFAIFSDETLTLTPEAQEAGRR